MSASHLHPRRSNAVILAELPLLLGIVGFTWFVTKSAVFQAEPRVFGIAVTVDLTVTASVCHWLLGIRLGGLPCWTVVPLSAAGFAVSRALLPADFEDSEAVAAVVVALIEGSALLLLVLNVRSIARDVRTDTAVGVNGFDALENALLKLAPSMPRLAAYARFELQLWTMFVFGWFLKRRPPDGPDVFTHHKRSRWFVLLGFFAFLTVIEAGAMHWVLHSYHFDTTKWIATAFSGYAFVWLLGDLQALRVYRSSLQTKNGERFLDLRIGARGHATIALSNIASVEIGERDRAIGGDEALFVLYGNANVRLSFRRPNNFKPMLGAERQVRALLTQVDDPQEFKRAVAE